MSLIDFPMINNEKILMKNNDNKNLKYKEINII